MGENDTTKYMSANETFTSIFTYHLLCASNYNAQNNILSVSLGELRHSLILTWLLHGRI